MVLVTVIVSVGKSAVRSSEDRSGRNDCGRQQTSNSSFEYSDHGLVSFLIGDTPPASNPYSQRKIRQE
jgi:hypothetical protein